VQRAACSMTIDLRRPGPRVLARRKHSVIPPHPGPLPAGEGVESPLPLGVGTGEGITSWRPRRSLPSGLTIHHDYVAGQHSPHPPNSRYESFQSAPATGSGRQERGGQAGPTGVWETGGRRHSASGPSAGLLGSVDRHLAALTGRKPRFARGIARSGGNARGLRSQDDAAPLILQTELEFIDDSASCG